MTSSTQDRFEEKGHGRIFDLAPKTDPLLAQIVPAARRKVCLNTSISAAARMFFCFLTDSSLQPGLNTRKGVVKFSDAALAERFKINPRTVRNWKRELESAGEIWMTEKWMKNCFPATVYNIAAIVGAPPETRNSESEDGSLVEEEVFSSNRRRRRLVQREAGSGKFSRRDTPRCPDSTPPETPKTPEMAVNKTPNEFFLPSTTAKNCRGPRQKIAAVHGKKQPSPPAKNSRLGRQKTAVARGKKQPWPAAKNSRGPRQKTADKEETEALRERFSETSFKRSTGLNAQKKLGIEGKIQRENLFLADVGAMMERWRPGSAKGELANSGAWWRTSYRANADLLQRVLADTNCAVKEGRIQTTPGQYAVDLWKRWSKDLLKERIHA
jgi:hypothetical protein